VETESGPGLRWIQGDKIWTLQMNDEPQILSDSVASWARVIGLYILVEKNKVDENWPDHRPVSVKA